MLWGHQTTWRDEVQLWNWKTGVLLRVRSRDMLSPFIHGTDGVVAHSKRFGSISQSWLLDSHHLLVAYEYSLRIYLVNSSSEKLPEDWELEPPKVGEDRSYICSLQMPPIGEVEGKWTHAFISTCKVQPATPTLFDDVDMAFVHNPNHTILAVSCQASRRSKALHHARAVDEHFLLFVPISIILAAVQRAGDVSSDMGSAVQGGIEVPWHDWGPSGTRFLQLRHPLWMFQVSGSRAVVLGDKENDRYLQDVYLDVFVFEVHTGANLDADLSAHPDLEIACGWDDVVRSMFIKSPGPRRFDGQDSALKEIVHTSLPFKITRKTVYIGTKDRCRGLVMTEDAVALVVRFVLL